MPGKRTAKRMGAWRGANPSLNPALLPHDLLVMAIGAILEDGRARRDYGRKRLSASTWNGGAFFGSSGDVTYLKQFRDLSRGMDGSVPGKVIVLAHAEDSGKMKIIAELIPTTISSTTFGAIVGGTNGNSCSTFNHTTGSDLTVSAGGTTKRVGQSYDSPSTGYRAYRRFESFVTSSFSGATIVRARLKIPTVLITQSNSSYTTDSLEVYLHAWSPLASGDYDVTGGTLLATVPSGVLATAGTDIYVEIPPASIVTGGSTEFKLVSNRERTGSCLTEDADREFFFDYAAPSLIVEVA